MGRGEAGAGERIKRVDYVQLYLFRITRRKRMNYRLQRCTLYTLKHAALHST